MTDSITLTRSYDEVDNVRTFVFDAADLQWQAGQYQTYTLPAAGDSPDDNQRFFTIASAPFENEIHISTRVSDSAFKQALNGMQPGDSISVKGLEGDFTWEDSSDEQVLLIAAGIGSTPYRSMLLQRQADGKPLSATLLYYNRYDSIPFKTEFDELAAKHPELTIEYVIGERISADDIMNRMPGATSKQVYISGPEAMVDTVGEELKARQVAVKQDWFPGYDENSY